MLSHCHDLGDDSIICPLYTEDLCELLQILGGGLTDRENGISQPAHAKAAQFLVEEVHTQLRRQERNVFDDGQPDAPLFVFRQLDNRGE